MKLVILTGGLASGKTTASQYFAKLGVMVHSADIIARNLVMPGCQCLAAIVEYFGKNILLANGQLNRASLRQHIFFHPQDKLWLERLMHPQIIQELQAKILAVPRAYKMCYQLCEIAIFFESTMHQLLAYDRVLTIECPAIVQQQRTWQRDNIAKLLINAMLNYQLNTHQRTAMADDVIYNNADQVSLQNNVISMHNYYLSLWS